MKTPAQINKEYRQRVREKANQVFGKKCFFCGHEVGRMPLHNKKGEKHPTDLTAREALKNPEDWVRLCKHCHRGVHFSMNILEMDWEQIVKLAKKV